MELIPFIGNEPVRSDAFSIVVSQNDLSRVSFLVSRTATIQSVTDKQSFEQASEFAGKLKTILAEIQDAKKAAKRPFAAVEQAVENKAQQISEALQNENKRILGLLNGYVSHLEAQQRAEQKRRDDALRLEKQRLEKIAAEAAHAQALAEAAARAAKDEAEELRAKMLASQMRQAQEEAELDQAIAEEVANIGSDKAKIKVVGGRIDHPWQFKLVNVKAAVDAGYLRCLRWEPDILACRDAVKAQLERWGPDATPHIPGFEISRETSVSVRASA